MANCKMFGGLFKPKFYNKCKAAIKLTKVRLEMINRKRDAMLKFLKKDIADLLKKDLDSNAYGRVEGLLAEQNITRCYKLIEEFCECVLDNLSNMTKQSECPEDCREAVASLAFAAARFADLPELRNLRSLLYEKYGKSIEIFINKEFASRLRPEHPSKEMKVQLMRDIAVEFSIEWDSKPLEQKLLTPPPKRIPTSQKSVQETREDEEEEEERIQAHVPREKPNSLLDTENKFVVREKLNPKETQNVFRHHLASSESSSQETIDVEDQIPPPNTEKGEEEVVEEAKMKPPYSYKNIPPPYRKEPKLESSSKPKPRSVRQRRPRPLTETSSSDVVDGEEKVLDGLLTHYSSKKSPYEVAEEPTSSWWWKGSKASEAKKVVSLEQEKTKVEEEDDQMKRHHRASSLGQSEMLGGGHVHPKLPEYEELAARIAKLSGET